MPTVTKQGGNTVYQVDQPDPLVCPKCKKEVEYLLGEEEETACEDCYDPSTATPPEPEAGEVVGIVGESNQEAELRGKPTTPIHQTQSEQLDEILSRK